MQRMKSIIPTVAQWLGELGVTVGDESSNLIRSESLFFVNLVGKISDRVRIFGVLRRAL